MGWFFVILSVFRQNRNPLEPTYVKASMLTVDDATDAVNDDDDDLLCN